MLSQLLQARWLGFPTCRQTANPQLGKALADIVGVNTSDLGVLICNIPTMTEIITSH